MDEVISGQKRGAKVEVILVHDEDIVKQKKAREWFEEVRCIREYKQLKEAGIVVFYYKIATYTHFRSALLQ